MKGLNASVELLKTMNNDFMQKSLSITVKRVITDINGSILIGGAVPFEFRTDYPFYLLGEFDRMGGYKIGQRIVPAPIPYLGVQLKYLTTFYGGGPTSVWNIIPFNPACEIQNEITAGDLVHVFTDDLAAPNGFAWIIQQNLDASISAIMSNVLSNDKFSQLWVKDIVYSTTNTNLAQFDQTINIVRMDSLGTQNTDSFLGNLYRTPSTALNNIIKIPKAFKLDQYIGIYSRMLYTTDHLKIVFNIQK